MELDFLSFTQNWGFLPCSASIKVLHPFVPKSLGNDLNIHNGINLD